MANVVEINTLEELEQYQLAWKSLLPQTPRASFFHTYQWLKTYWQYFGAAQKLRVLIVRSGGKTIGIVPLCVRTESHAIGPVRVLTYPLSDWGMWYGPIGPNPAASLFMAMQHLKATPRDSDMLDLRWSGKSPGEGDPIGRAMRAAGWPCEQRVSQQTSVVRMEGLSWERYLATRAKKWRQEMGRQQRSLYKNFEVCLERHRPLGGGQADNDPRWDLYEDCLTIAELSWQGASTTGSTLSHESVRDFLKASHRVAAELGMLDMMVLKLDGRPAAFQYNYHYQGNLFGLRMGFDRDFVKQGVGRALMGWLLQDSCARGDRLLDLGLGDYEFKRRFRTEVQASYSYAYYPPQAWRGQSLRLTRWVKSHWKTEKGLATKC